MEQKDMLQASATILAGLLGSLPPTGLPDNKEQIFCQKAYRMAVILSHQLAGDE